MRWRRNGYTPRQRRYAELVMNNINKSKKEMALQAGYSQAAALSVMDKIESTEGYANARRELSLEAGEVASAAFYSLKNRDMDKMDTETILKLVTVISDAVAKLAPQDHIKQGRNDDVPNKLRTIVLQNVETQNIQNEKPI